MKHPGDAAAEYLSENVMTAVSRALTATLESRPNHNPVKSFAKLLQLNNGLRPVTQIDVNLSAGVAAKGISSSSSNSSSHASSAASVACGTSAVTFISRPCVMETDAVAQSRGFALPTSFFKCGDFPIYSCDAPSLDVLSNVAKHLVQTDKVTSICWVIASTSNTLLAYIRGDAFCAKIDPRLWEKERADVRGPSPDDEDAELGLLSKAATALGRKAKLLPFPDAAVSLEVDGLSAQVVRVFHPSDLPADPRVVDCLTAAMDKFCKSDSAACVLLTCGEPVLREHLRTLLTIYFRQLRTVQHIRRTLHVVESQENLEFVRDFERHEKTVRTARAQRDKTREMLFRAHVANLVDEGKLDFDEEYAANDARKQARAARRAVADKRLAELMQLQNGTAAIKVQKMVRGLLTRRKSEARIQKSSEECMRLYEHGRFPLIEATIGYLQLSYGGTLISADIPKRGATHESPVWKFTKIRVAPVDDVDISSEDEEWEEVIVNRMNTEVSKATNPHFDVDCCLKISENRDKAFLYECYLDYLNDNAMQTRSVRVLERLIHYILYAVYVFVHLRCVEAASPDVSPFASKALLDLPHKLEGVEHYEGFLFLNRRPLEWLSQVQFLMQTIANQPTSLWALRRLCGGSPQELSPSMTSSGAAHPTAATATGQLFDHHYTEPLLGHRSSPIFVVPDGLTTDQWTEAAACALRGIPKGRKVLWITTNPELCVYANGTPFFLIHRHSQDVVEAGEGGGSSVTLAKSGAAVLLRDEGTMPMDQSIIGKSQRSASFTAVDDSSSAQVDVPIPVIKVSRSASLSGDALAPAGTSQLHGALASGVGAGLRKTEGSWFSLSWDRVETAVVDDLVTLIDSNPAEGKLPYFTKECARPTNRNPGEETGVLGVLGVEISPSHLYARRQRKEVLVETGTRVTMIHEPRGSSRSRRISQFASAGLSNLTPRQSISVPSSGVAAAPMVTHAPSSTFTHSPSGQLVNTSSMLTKHAIRAPRVNRKGSTASVTTTSENEVESDQNDVAQYPPRAEEALRTPQQAADEVKQRLRANGYESGMLYRRLPVFPHFCDEYLRALDGIFLNLRENLMDPSVALVFTIAGPESVLHATLGAILWATDYKKVWQSSIMCGQSFCKSPGSPTAFKSPNSFSSNLVAEPIFGEIPQQLGERPISASTSASAGPSGPPDMMTDFPILAQIDDENPHLQLAEVVTPFVAQLLHESCAQRILYDPILEAMTAAKRAPTVEECRAHCIEAACGFEKLLLLLFFKAFCDSVQDKRVGAKWSFRDYIINNSPLHVLLLLASPWERQPADQRCPLDPTGTAFSADHRWRRPLVMPNNS
jgi:hypothetical protein